MKYFILIIFLFIVGCHDHRWHPSMDEQPIVYDYPHRIPTQHELKTIRMFQKNGNVKGLKRFLRKIK